MPAPKQNQPLFSPYPIKDTQIFITHTKKLTCNCDRQHSVLQGGSGNVQFQKRSIPNPREVIENSEGMWGFNLECPEEWGVQTKELFLWEGCGIFPGTTQYSSWVMYIYKWKALSWEATTTPFPPPPEQKNIAVVNIL